MKKVRSLYKLKQSDFVDKILYTQYQMDINGPCKILWEIYKDCDEYVAECTSHGFISDYRSPTKSNFVMYSSTVLGVIKSCITDFGKDALFHAVPLTYQPKPLNDVLQIVEDHHETTGLDPFTIISAIKSRKI